MILKVVLDAGKILLPRCCYSQFILTAFICVRMRRCGGSNSKSYDLDNCFGFNENENNLSFLNNSTLINDTIAPVEFQENKPYRLAFYVKPSEQRRLHRANASILVKSIVEKCAKNKKNDTNTSIRSISKSEIQKTRRKEVKPKNVMLFDENVKPNISSKKVTKTPEKPKESKKIVSFFETTSARKNVLKEINTKPVTKTRQNKTRRSYERKVKEHEPEVIVEPPSEEILKEMDMKKITKTKQKKPNKEEQEFENWANNMNTAFDDVDKFELSITYD